MSAHNGSSSRSVRSEPSEYPYEHYEPFDEKAALRNQIVRTREDLGETLQELAARTDVKARAKEMAADVRARTTDAVRMGARRASERTRSGASSARSLMSRAGDSPAVVVIGAGAGALAGLGIYALIRSRLPFGPSGPTRAAMRWMRRLG